MSRQALGRGLGALLPTNELDMVKKIPLEQIRPNPFQPRKDFNDEALKELAESIKTHGVLQPVLLRKTDDSYELIAGERRWRAAKIAGLTDIPAIIKEIDEKSMSQMALIENLQREDLNPIEEAIAYQSLLEKFSMTQEEVATAVGKNRVTITNALRLLKLPPFVLDNVSRGTISAGHAKALLSLSDEAIQKEICLLVIEEGWNVRQTEDYVRRIVDGAGKKAEKKERKTVQEDIFIKDLSNKIGEHLGTRVKIKPGKKVSKIEIEYYNNDDLQRIIKSIGLEK